MTTDHDKLEDVWESRADKLASSITYHPFRWVAWVVGFIVVASIIGGIGHFALGWWSTAVKVVSPENVTAQYRLAFQDYNALEAAAQNACIVRDALNGLEPGSDAYNQRQSQLLAIQSNYNRIKSEYEARMQNIFEANKVKPAQLPFEAPSEEGMEGQVCTP